MIKWPSSASSPLSWELETVSFHDSCSNISALRLDIFIKRQQHSVVYFNAFIIYCNLMEEESCFRASIADSAVINNMSWSFCGFQHMHYAGWFMYSEVSLIFSLACKIFIFYVTSSDLHRDKNWDDFWIHRKMLPCWTAPQEAINKSPIARCSFNKEVRIHELSLGVEQRL